MSAEDHGFIKWFLTIYRARLTQSGKILFWAALIGASTSAPGTIISAYLVPSFIVAIFLSSFLCSRFFRPKISAIRIFSSPPNAGSICVYQVRIKNNSRRALRNISVFEGLLPYGLYAVPDHETEANFIEYIKPYGEATATLVMRCAYRGMYQLPPLLIGSSFPSGILRAPVAIKDSDNLIVYPKFISQATFKLPFNRVYQPGGIAVSSHVGDSNEFLSTREYRSGDRLRDIHWLSYARTGKLIVKEYVEEYFVRIGLLLDTELTRRDKYQFLEDRISLAAGIADALARKEYIIDIFAAGHDLHHFQMGRALAHLDNLLELLACVEGVRKIDYARLQADLDAHLKRLSSMIILLKDWDNERAQLCRYLRSQGCQLRILILRDKPLSMTPTEEVTLISEFNAEEMVF